MDHEIVVISEVKVRDAPATDGEEVIGAVYGVLHDLLKVHVKKSTLCIIKTN